MKNSLKATALRASLLQWLIYLAMGAGVPFLSLLLKRILVNPETGVPLLPLIVLAFLYSRWSELSPLQ